MCFSVFEHSPVYCVCVHKVLFLQGVCLRDSVYVAEAILFLKVNDLIVNHVTSTSLSFPPLPLRLPSSAPTATFTEAVAVYAHI